MVMGPPAAMIALQTHQSGVSRRSGYPRVVWSQGKLGMSPLPLGMQLTEGMEKNLAHGLES
jgi:hypothetical protein